MIIKSTVVYIWRTSVTEATDTPELNPRDYPYEPRLTGNWLNAFGIWFQFLPPFNLNPFSLPSQILPLHIYIQFCTYTLRCCERRLSNRDFRFFVPLSVISLSCIEAFMDILMGMIDSCSLSLIFEMRGGLGAVNRITRRYTKIPIIPCKPPHCKLRTV